MSDALVSRRDLVVWAGGWLAVAVLLVAVDFSSSDGDSALYAGLSERLAQEPVARWVAPEWWGFWPEAGMTGLFREHPAGALIIPAALVRLGVPGGQAAYIVGIAAGLTALVMIATLAARVVPRCDARALLVLLQLMPVAFLFRIRANHEYLMLVSLLMTLTGLEVVRRSWIGFALVAAGLSSALLIKGVFVVVPLIGAVLWVLFDPAGGGRPRRRLVLALVCGGAFAAVAGVAYEWWFRAVTGEAYWVPYWRRQLGQVEVATPVGGGIAALAGHAFFYVNRVAWHAAPWSLALAVAGWMWATAGTSRARWQAGTGAERRTLLFSLSFAAALVVMLSPSSRVAERYIFSGTYAAAAAGAIVALRAWPRLGARLDGLDRRIPAFPALVWIALMLARLAIGPLVPRIG